MFNHSECLLSIVAPNPGVGGREVGRIVPHEWSTDSTRPVESAAAVAPTPDQDSDIGILCW